MSAAVPPTRLHPLRFADLDGWADDDHRAAFAAFRRGAAVVHDHPLRRRVIGADPTALQDCLDSAAALPDDLSPESARAFFEARFRPFAVGSERAGLFTGYYEPVVSGSRTRSAAFKTPLYHRPDDLVDIDPDDPPPGIAPGPRFARRCGDSISAYPDRAAIEAGYLAGRGLELVYVADAVEAFFIHIQGAARIRLTGGGEMRVTYAAKSGHPYTPIGRVLIARGALRQAAVTMQAIRHWLADHPAEAGAVMAENRSFIFFRETPLGDPGLGPIGAAKIPLTSRRSLAVDRLLHSFHTPVWVETDKPDGRRFCRLMVAQDTGSAITGPARGDIFFGTGDDAGAVAGAMKSAGRFVVLLPAGRGP